MSEEEDIFHQFQPRSQSPPKSGDDSSNILMKSVASRGRSARSGSGSDRDRHINANVESDDDNESRDPSLADLTTASRPDPRAQTRISDRGARHDSRTDSRSRKAKESDSDLSRTRGAVRTSRGEHSGGARKASGGRYEETRRRRHRREDVLEEESEEEDTEFGRYHARSSRIRKGYSPVNGSRKKGSLITRTVLGAFEGVNLKTVVLCILAMVLVANLVEHRDRNKTDDATDAEDWIRDSLVKAPVKDTTPFQDIKELESMITPGVRGGMVKVEEDHDEAPEESNAGLYANKEESNDGAQTLGQAGGASGGVMDGQTQTVQVDTFNAQMQQQVDTQQQQQIGGQQQQPMQGYDVGQGAQQQPLQGYQQQQQQQPGMVNQFGQPQQQPGMGGYPMINQQQQQMGMNQFGQQAQMAFPNQMGMAGQFGQQQPMGRFGMNPMGMGGQFSQQQGYGMQQQQQPMYPGQIVPPMGQQQPMISQGQQAQVDGQYGVQQAAPAKQATQQQAGGVPLLQEVPQGYGEFDLHDASANLLALKPSKC